MKNQFKKNKKEKSRQNNLRIIITLSAIALTLICCGIIAVAYFLHREEPIAVIINELEVDVREFNIVARGERADVLSKLGGSFGEDGGELLKAKTLEKLTRIKVQQQQMMDAGILSDSSYVYFHEMWQAESANTEYGAAVQSEEQYYQTRMDKDILALQQHLALSQLAVSEEERTSFYNTHAEPFMLDEQGAKKSLAVLAAVIDKRLVEEAYELWIDELVRDAKLEVRERVMSKIIFD